MPDGAWSEPRSLVTNCCGRGHLVAHKTLPGFLPPYSTFLFLTRLQQWPLRAVPSLAPSPTSLALSSAPPSLPGPDGPSSQQLPLARSALPRCRHRSEQRPSFHPALSYVSPSASPPVRPYICPRLALTPQCRWFVPNGNLELHVEQKLNAFVIGVGHVALLS